MAHAGRGQIQPQRRAQPSRADHQHAGALQLELPLHAHLGHDQVPAVALDLFLRKFHFLLLQCCRSELPRTFSSNSLPFNRRTHASGSRSDPPAIEGTMLIVSPSLVCVFSLSRKRMSSSFR